MAWARAWMVVATLVAAGLAGCVQAREVDGDPPPHLCARASDPIERGDDGCCWGGCCDDCGCWGMWGCAVATPAPAHPTIPAPTPCVSYGSSMRFTEPAWVVCDPPQPPLFEPFSERTLRECAGCSEVALAVDRDRILVATAEGLDLLTRARHLQAPSPTPAALAGVWTLRSPAVASDGLDVWYAAIAQQALPPGLAPLEALVVARWDGASGWLRQDVLGLEALPDPSVIERVQLVPTRDGIVALVEAKDLAWSFHLGDALLEPPEPFALPDASLRLGAATRDGDGRAMVPYVRTSLGGGASTLGIATLADVDSAWSHAAVSDGGMGVSLHAVPALEAPPQGAFDAAPTAIAWIDALGRLVRATSYDGSAWTDPMPWRPDGMPTSSPAAAHDGRVATLAWAEDHRVVLARGAHAPSGWTEMERDTRSPPALALQGPAAVVAWLAPERGLIVAVEGAAPPGACDRTSLCSAY